MGNSISFLAPVSLFDAKRGAFTVATYYSSSISTVAIFKLCTSLHVLILPTHKILTAPSPTDVQSLAEVIHTDCRRAVNLPFVVCFGISLHYSAST